MVKWWIDDVVQSLPWVVDFVTKFLSEKIANDLHRHLSQIDKLQMIAGLSVVPRGPLWVISSRLNRWNGFFREHYQKVSHHVITEMKKKTWIRPRVSLRERKHMRDLMKKKNRVRRCLFTFKTHNDARLKNILVSLDDGYMDRRFDLDLLCSSQEEHDRTVWMHSRKPNAYGDRFDNNSQHLEYVDSKSVMSSKEGTFQAAILYPTSSTSWSYITVRRLTSTKIAVVISNQICMQNAW